MGFFSDLKEDLSQAVNELMPEEALDAAMAGDAGTEDASEEEQLTKDETAGTADSVDLTSMLDQLEEPDTAEEPLEEVVISPDDASDDTAWTAEVLPEETVVTGEEPEEAGTAAEPETADAQEPEESAEETEAAAEAEDTQEPETEAQPDDTTVELGEEEENMDAQTQTQEQTLTQEQINRVAVDETAVVTEGMTITGDIVSAGSMELIGTVNGNLDIYGKLNITGTIQGDSKAAEIFAEGAKITGEVNSQGSVKIGQSSVVIGNIMAASAVIAGAVKGDIDVQGPVILDTTAIVMGNIKSKSVQINNGAVIEGFCSQCYADIDVQGLFDAK